MYLLLRQNLTRVRHILAEPPFGVLKPARRGRTLLKSESQRADDQRRRLLGLLFSSPTNVFTYLYATYMPLPNHLCTLYILLYILYLYIVLIKRESSRL